MYYIILIYYINEYTILASNHIKLEYNIVGNGRVYWSLKKGWKTYLFVEIKVSLWVFGVAEYEYDIIF